MIGDFFLLFCQKYGTMKKITLASFALLLIFACSEKKSTKNLQITGNIKGLKKGTLYIQKIVDTSLVAIDTITIDGDSHFASNIDIKSPEMLYLFLDRGVTNSIDNNLPFFAEPGKINIDTDLEYFFAKAKITGSKNQELYEMFKKVSSRYNNETLSLTEAKFKAIKTKNQSSFDSIEKLQSNILKRKYLYAVNFAMTNKNYEVSPYVVLSEINNVNIKYMDTIQKAMTPKVAKSKYGKMLTDYLNERKKTETK